MFSFMSIMRGIRLVQVPKMSEVIVLYDGFSAMINDNCMRANATCTLIKGEHNIIVDTMTPWDTSKILNGVEKNGLSPDEVNFVVSTHGHSDHTGNNNLFQKAKHIVGFSIAFHENYFIHDFNAGKEYVINESVKVIPTIGHTLSDVTVLVQTHDKGVIAIAGDLFEREDDIDDSKLWIEAGSEDPSSQVKNRYKVAMISNWIVPGHGPMFKVTDSIREKLKNQMDAKTQDT